MNKEKLLAILDMSEAFQRQWLLVHIFKERMPHESTADLAFRLRDELVLHTPYSDRYAFDAAFEIVYEHVKRNEEEGTDKANWGLDYSKPIHWVIASLIAKEAKDV